MSAELDPGQTIGGRYRVEKLIGQGGFGAVYRAVHVAVDRHVAIKVIRADASRDAEQRADLVARFKREARVVAALRHPSTVTLYDFWAEDASLYMVLEYIDGITGDALVRHDAPIESRRVARLVTQAAGALAEAHRNGLVHRDIKPPNLIVTRDADGGELLKVLDFGIAKIVDDAPQDSFETRAGLIIGSPPYMAPEQIINDGIGHPTDQYALAVVAYEMLAGKRPFVGPLKSVLTQHMQKPPPPMASTLAVPPAVEAAVQRALSKSPGDRYPDITAFAVALTSGVDAPAVSLSVGAALPPTAPLSAEPAATAASPSHRSTRGSATSDHPPTTRLDGSTRRGLLPDAADPIEPNASRMLGSDAVDPSARSASFEWRGALSGERGAPSTPFSPPPRSRSPFFWAMGGAVLTLIGVGATAAWFVAPWTTPPREVPSVQSASEPEMVGIVETAAAVEVDATPDAMVKDADVADIAVDTARPDAAAAPAERPRPKRTPPARRPQSPTTLKPVVPQTEDAPASDAPEHRVEVELL